MGTIVDFKPLIFISGKGGTGKTTLGLFVARHLAAEGKKVLFVELAPRSSARALLESSLKPDYKPTASGWGFDWCTVEGLDCLIEYVSSFTGIESVTQKVFENSIIKTLVNVAPGLNDLSVLGKLTSQYRGHGPGYNYQHVVIDAHSTGSFSSLLKAPKWLGGSVSSGPLKKQSEAIEKILKDKSIAQYLIVGLFEELPVDELEDTWAEFHDIIGEQLSVIMNKRIALANVELDDKPWQQFIKNKLESQAAQKKRVLELCSSAFSFDLFTGPLKDEMIRHQGDFLRPL